MYMAAASIGTKMLIILDQDCLISNINLEMKYVLLKFGTLIPTSACLMWL